MKLSTDTSNSTNSSAGAKGTCEALFNDKLTDTYSHFCRQHFHPDGPFPRITEIVVSLVEASVEPIIVDLASGQGEPAISIAKELPQATVYSVDISPAMSSVASLKSEGLSNVRIKLADMQDLAPLFDDNSVDIVTCCYGFMFPPDKVRALKETLRILKPGGTLIATTWDNLGYFEFVNQVMSHILGDEFDGYTAFTPVSLSEAGLFEKLIKNAGFDMESMNVSTSKYPLDLTNDPEFHVEMFLAFDDDKRLSQTERETIQQAVALLGPKYLEIKDDGTYLATNNTYKCVVVKKGL